MWKGDNNMLDNAMVCPYCKNELFIIQLKSKDKNPIRCAKCLRYPYKAHQIRRFK